MAFGLLFVDGWSRVVIWPLVLDELVLTEKIDCAVAAENVKARQKSRDARIKVKAEIFISNDVSLVI